MENLVCSVACKSVYNFYIKCFSENVVSILSLSIKMKIPLNYRLHFLVSEQTCKFIIGLIIFPSTWKENPVEGCISEYDDHTYDHLSSHDIKYFHQKFTLHICISLKIISA